MKAHKIEILIIDHDGLGVEEIKSVIENQKYPNWCINPEVKSINTIDIGDWHDDHPLNLSYKSQAEYEKLFNSKGEGEL